MKSFKEAAVKVPMGKFKELAKTIAVGTIEKSPEKKVMGYLQAMGKKVRLERDPNSKSGFRVVIEKSVSKSQQRFMGMVRAVQKGDMKAPSPEVAKAAKSMKKKDVKDFASTKHKGLPEMKTFREMREGAMSKDKEKHDTGGFRISNADAKAARDRIMQKKQKSAPKMEDNIDEAEWKKEGPWKKVKPGERKDKFGNTVKDKNVPRNLARSAMKKTAAGKTEDTSKYSDKELKIYHQWAKSSKRTQPTDPKLKKAVAKELDKRATKEDNIDELSTALATRAANKASKEYDHYKKTKNGAMAYHRGSQARSFKRYSTHGDYYAADR